MFKFILSSLFVVVFSFLPISFTWGGTGGFAELEPEEYLNLAITKIEGEIKTGTPDEALLLFSKIYLDPAQYTNGIYFNSPKGELSFQLKLATHLFNSPSWGALDKVVKVIFIKIALKQRHSYSLFVRDLVERLRKIGTLEAMSLVYRELKSQRHYLSLEGTKTREGYVRENHSGLFSMISSWVTGSELNETPISPKEIKEIIRQWVIKKYKGNPNKLMKDVRLHHSKEPALIVYLMENSIRHFSPLALLDGPVVEQARLDVGMKVTLTKDSLDKYNLFRDIIKNQNACESALGVDIT